MRAFTEISRISLSDSTRQNGKDVLDREKFSISLRIRGPSYETRGLIVASSQAIAGKSSSLRVGEQ